MIDDESFKYLKEIRDRLPKNKNKPASYSDVIKYHRSLNRDINKLVLDNFTDLNNILLSYYKGNADKAHLSEQLRLLCVQALMNEKKYISISKGIHEIMKEFFE